LRLFPHVLTQMKGLLYECTVKAAERKNLPPLRGWEIFVVYPVLTLRLRSGQAHWAKVCRASGALD
jgi:hypothetical protein